MIRVIKSWLEIISEFFFYFTHDSLNHGAASRHAQAHKMGSLLRQKMNTISYSPSNPEGVTWTVKPSQSPGGYRNAWRPDNLSPATRYPLPVIRPPPEKSCRVNHTMRWFSRPKFRISGLHYTVTTQMEKESSNECAVFFLWTKETFRLRNLPSRNSTMFSFKYGRGEQNFPRQRSFCRLFRYLFRYGQENYFFKLR